MRRFLTKYRHILASVGFILSLFFAFSTLILPIHACETYNDMVVVGYKKPRALCELMVNYEASWETTFLYFLIAFSPIWVPLFILVGLRPAYEKYRFILLKVMAVPIFVATYIVVAHYVVDWAGDCNGSGPYGNPLCDGAGSDTILTPIILEASNVAPFIVSGLYVYCLRRYIRKSSRNDTPSKKKKIK